MDQQALIPHLFRTEYRKIVSVLCNAFGIDHIEIAEDLVSDTFLLASEIWGLKGVPQNPAAWLYTVARNKTKDHFKHHTIFAQTVSKNIQYLASRSEEIEIDLSVKNIKDSQLAMMFVVCDPCNSPEAQIGLALNLLCGFGVSEIAHAFITSKDVVYKRLQRAKENLRHANISIEQPSLTVINERLPSVLMTLYLLFNKGYYSPDSNNIFSKEVCGEAIRLVELLLENEQTSLPSTFALLALMFFQCSRLDARSNDLGEVILYDDQDESLWDTALIKKGEALLNLAAQGSRASKYHLEAGIAYWHTIKSDTKEKWDNILMLYNQLLLTEYSPIAALNRTYALAKTNGKEQAIIEAEKINLTGNHLYHALLGELYLQIDDKKSKCHLQTALSLARSDVDRKVLLKKMEKI